VTTQDQLSGETACLVSVTVSGVLLTALVPGDLRAVDASSPDDFFTTIDSSSYEGKWRVVSSGPRTSHRLPNRDRRVRRLNNEFADRDAQVLGARRQRVRPLAGAAARDLKDLPSDAVGP